MHDLLQALEKLDDNNKLKRYPDVDMPVYFHLSTVSGLKSLVPQRKEYVIRKKKEVRRVSLADTMQGCVSALVLPFWGTNFKYYDEGTMGHTTKARTGERTWEFVVYTVQKTDIKKSEIVEHEETDLTKVSIFDILMTGEIAYGRAVKCMEIGKVTITKLTQAECTRRWGTSDHMAPILLQCTVMNDFSFRFTPYDFNLTSAEHVVKHYIEEGHKAYVERLRIAMRAHADITRANAAKAVATFNTLAANVKNIEI